MSPTLQVTLSCMLDYISNISILWNSTYNQLLNSHLPGVSLLLPTIYVYVNTIDDVKTKLQYQEHVTPNLVLLKFGSIWFAKHFA